MKNLFKSASANGNPAKKFIYMSEIMGNNENVSTETNSVDYSDVSDLEGKYVSPKMTQEDPDVDQDFMAQIESQEEERPYVENTKKIAEILKKIGTNTIDNRDEFHPTETYYKEITNIDNPSEKISYSLSQTGGYAPILTIKTNSSEYAVILQGEYLAKYDGPQNKKFQKLSLDEKNQWFSEEIEKLLSKLKENVDKNDEPRRATGLIFDDEAYDNTPKIGDRGFKGINDIIKRAGEIVYTDGENNTVRIKKNSYGGFIATSTRTNGSFAGFVETKMIGGKMKTFDKNGEEDYGLRIMVDSILDEVKKYN